MENKKKKVANIVAYIILFFIGLGWGLLITNLGKLEKELNNLQILFNQTLEYVEYLENELAEKNKTIEMYENLLNRLNNTFNSYRENVSKFVSYSNNANARLVYNALDYFNGALDYIGRAHDSYNKYDFFTCWYNAYVCQGKADLAGTHFKSVLNYLNNANKYYNNSEYYEFISTYLKCSQFLSRECEYYAKACQSFYNGDYTMGNSYIDTFNSYVDKFKDCMDEVEKIYIRLTK